MNNQEEFSYVVTIDSQQARDLVHSIGPEISNICEKYNILYPVDFTYGELIVDEQYLIYSV